MLKLIISVWNFRSNPVVLVNCTNIRLRDDAARAFLRKSGKTCLRNNYC